MTSAGVRFDVNVLLCDVSREKHVSHFVEETELLFSLKELRIFSIVANAASTSSTVITEMYSQKRVHSSSKGSFSKAEGVAGTDVLSEKPGGHSRSVKYSSPLNPMHVLISERQGTGKQRRAGRSKKTCAAIPHTKQRPRRAGDGGERRLVLRSGPSVDVPNFAHREKRIDIGLHLV